MTVRVVFESHLTKLGFYVILRGILVAVQDLVVIIRGVNGSHCVIIALVTLIIILVTELPLLLIEFSLFSSSYWIKIIPICGEKP